MVFSQWTSWPGGTSRQCAPPRCCAEKRPAAPRECPQEGFRVGLVMRKHCTDLGWGSYRIECLFFRNVCAIKDRKTEELFQLKETEELWQLNANATCVLVLDSGLDRRNWHSWLSWLNLNRVYGLDSSVLLNWFPDFEAYWVIMLAKSSCFQEMWLECLREDGISCLQWH